MSEVITKTTVLLAGTNIETINGLKSISCVELL